MASIDGRKFQALRLSKGYTAKRLLIESGYPKAATLMSWFETGRYKKMPRGIILMWLRILNATMEEIESDE